MQTAKPKQQKQRILPILFIIILFALMFLPGCRDLHGLFAGLIAGLVFSFYPWYLAGAITLLALAVGGFSVAWSAFLPDCLMTVPLCVLLGCFFKKPQEPPVILLSSLLTETAGLSVALLLSSRRAGFNLLDRFFDDMSTNLSASFTELEQAGAFPENVDLAQLQELFLNMVETYRLRVPFFLLLGASAIAVLFYLALLWLRRSCGKKASPLPPFRYFRLTRPAAALIVISFLGSLLLSGTVAIALENLYTYLTLMMVVNGLSYAAYWLKRKGISTPLRGLILIAGTGVALFFSILWYLLLMLGLTDAMWNLRGFRFPERKE